MGERHCHFAAVGGQADAAGQFIDGVELVVGLGDFEQRRVIALAQRFGLFCQRGRRRRWEIGPLIAVHRARIDQTDVPRTRLAALRGLRRPPCRQPQLDVGPVLAGALRNDGLALQIECRGLGVESGAVGRTPARLRHQVFDPHLSGALGRQVDRDLSRVFGPRLQALQIALERLHLLVERALAHLDALHASERIGSAAANSLEHRAELLRIDHSRLAGFARRAQVLQVVGLQLRSLALDIEPGDLIAQRFDSRLELGHACAAAVRGRLFQHADFADANARVSIDAQALRIELDRQADELQPLRTRGDLRHALDHRAARMQGHADDARCAARCVLRSRTDGAREQQSQRGVTGKGSAHVGLHRCDGSCYVRRT